MQIGRLEVEGPLLCKSTEVERLLHRKGNDFVEGGSCIYNFFIKMFLDRIFHNYRSMIDAAKERKIVAIDMTGRFYLSDVAEVEADFIMRGKVKAMKTSFHTILAMSAGVVSFVDKAFFSFFDNPRSQKNIDFFNKRRVDTVQNLLNYCLNKEECDQRNMISWLETQGIGCDGISQDDSIALIRQAGIFSQTFIYASSVVNCLKEERQYLPLKELIKVGRKESLNRQEESALTEFVKTVNKKSVISSIEIYIMLKMLASRYNNVSHAAMEIELYKRGCRPLTSKDEEYSRYVSLHKKGSVITCHGERYRITADCPMPYSEYRYKDFEIEAIGPVLRLDSEDAGKLLCSSKEKDIFLRLFLHNRIDSFVHSEYSGDFWEKELSPTIKSIDFGMVIYERVGDPLDDVEWDAETDALTELDMGKIAVLGNFVTLCIQAKKMPIDILRNGFWGRSFQSIKFENLKSEPFDFVKMKDVLWKFSRGNRIVFSSLIKASTLYDYPSPQHSVGILYQEAFIAAVHGKSFNPVNNVAVILGVEDARIVDDLTYFIESIKTEKRKILTTIQDTYEANEFFDRKRLDRNITRYLIERYKKEGCISQVPERIYSDMLSSIIMSVEMSVKKGHEIAQKIKEILAFLYTLDIRNLGDLNKQLTSDTFRRFGIANPDQVREQFTPRIYRAFECLIELEEKGAKE